MSISVRTTIFRLSISLACVTGMSISAASVTIERHSIYRWTDAMGQVHFGDRQDLHQKNQKAETLLLQTNIIKSIPASDSFKRQPTDEEKDIRWKRRPVPVSEDVMKMKRCQQAETQLREVRSIMRNGYKPSQFNRLHQRELKALKKRGEYCQD
ncbi:MAG: DUF4124 domain-containing protein [Gammaproteobacteria bacterium]